MRKVFSLLLTFAALLLSHAAAARPQSREAGPEPPPAPCGESVSKELYGRFRKNFKGSPEQQSEARRAAEEYLCRCASYDKVTLFMSEWLARYENRHHSYPDAEAAEAAAAREDEKRPPCRCDEMREQLRDTLAPPQPGGGLAWRDAETAMIFLELCGDVRRPFDRDLRDRLGEYGRDARHFGERRRAEGPAAKGPAKEQ